MIETPHVSCMQDRWPMVVPVSHTEELVPGEAYYIHEVCVRRPDGWGRIDPVYFRKYRGRFVRLHQDPSVAATFVYFTKVYFVKKELSHYQGPSLLVVPDEDDTFVYRFYREARPVVERRLRRRMLVALGLTDDLAELVIGLT